MVAQEQVVAHIGVCAINGFRIPTPYLVKDMSDMSYEVNPPTFNTLPASINMDFNRKEDNYILGSTAKFCFWWERRVPTSSPMEPELKNPEVTWRVTNDHFLLWVKTVSACCL